MVKERLQRNLDRLLREVASASAEESSRGDGGTSPPTLGKQIAQRVPLSHATGQATFAGILEKDRLLSYQKLVELGLGRPDPRGAQTVEATADTEDSVFTYAAPFRYPETSCGLLFRAELEQHRSDEAIATPFDSGATFFHLRPKDSTHAQIAFLRAHELPAPEYRFLLEQLLERCFASPWNYIDGVHPQHPWPIPVQGGDRRRWTFEVRFRDEIRLTGSLLAVFLPVAVASEQTVLRRIVEWRQNGVEVKVFQTSKTDDWSRLQSQSVKYLREFLGQ